MTHKSVTRRDELLEDAHRDGWRALIDESPNQDAIVLSLVRYEHGEEQERTAVAVWPDHEDNWVKAECMAGLVRAIARFLNRGMGEDLRPLVARISALADHQSLECPYELIGIEYDETHATIYQLPDGDYLRIIEDEYTEVLDSLTMVQHYGGTDFDDAI